MFLDLKVVTTSDRKLHDRGIQDGERVFMDGVGTLEPAQAKAVLRDLQLSEGTKIRQMPKAIAIDGQEAGFLLTGGSNEDRTDATVVPRVLAGTDRVVVDLSLRSSFLPQGKDSLSSLLVVRPGQTAIVRQFAAPDRGVVVLLSAELVETGVGRSAPKR